MNASFDVAAYSSTFAAVQAKLDNLHTTQAAILEKERLVKAARAEKAKINGTLLELKKGLDLRSISKEDRNARTLFLREAGILRLNEEITKVREARMKQE